MVSRRTARRGRRYDPTMRSVPPSLPTRRRGDPRGEPVKIGDVLGLALPPRVRGRMLDLEFLRMLWTQAAPDGLARTASPARFENKVLTLVADDTPTHVEAYRRRKEIASRLLRAAGLPDVRLRVRVELRRPGIPEAAPSAGGFRS